ncbi:transglutaminase-like cysteine peptidase [Alteromonas gilva]|uniref:Transglutaminase-like cysteine peptidase n=1 Tax=Alteromonas gilva TaxID=2987522 RepID=A0ABT5KXR5_9ALTE|nr:transglutaminase-like cysteine peptidase [Alteromonas gilva]MDC8829560.1 transglutaminase-like cysteine peptidase [Alteromonas gilva]
MRFNNARINSFLLLSLAVLMLSGTIFAIGPLRFTPELFNRIEQEYGTSARERVADWQQELLDLQSEDIDEQLYEINRFFNSIPYYEDSVHFKQADYWATPVEMLATNGGDCEDYTIAKYFSLRALGVPEENMRMMYVKALDYNQAHMVLAYYPSPNAVPFILDNINPRILPASRRTDLQPVYSFNGEGLWLAKAQGRGKQLGSGSRHKLWEDLTTRIERGF